MTFVDKLYDAEDYTLNLETMEELMNKPGETYGSWFTRQSFRVVINYYDKNWYADVYDNNILLKNYSESSIFELISCILKHHGR